MYYQYGENRYARDTSLTDGNGVARFESKDTLTGGVFLLFLSHKKALEFLLTDENEFTLSVDTNDIMGSVTFTNSTENTSYYAFLKQYKSDEFQMDYLKKRLRAKNTRQDSVTLIKNMILLYEKQLIQLKKQCIAKQPNSFNAHLIGASLPVEAPPGLSGKARVAYLKKHFLDHIAFSDEKLAYSNVLYINYSNYINAYGFPETDSVIACCDTLLQRAGASREVFKWSLYFLGNSFERSSVTGQDKIFVHLVDTYYKKNRSWWLSQEQLKKIFRKSEALKKVFIGSVCPDFTALDSSGKETNLHQQIKKTSILVFWSYDCKHCLEEMPKLSKWLKKHPEISLITACALPDEEEWKEKLRLFNLPGIHVIDPDRKANYIETYSISSTPQIFVINSEKIIMAKYIEDTAELDAFFKHKK